MEKLDLHNVQALTTFAIEKGLVSTRMTIISNCGLQISDCGIGIIIIPLPLAVLRMEKSHSQDFIYFIQ